MSFFSRKEEGSFTTPTDGPASSVLDFEYRRVCPDERNVAFPDS